MQQSRNRRRTLGHLVTAHAEAGNPKVTVVEVGRAMEPLKAMDKPAFMKKMTDFAKRKLKVDLNGPGYVVVHPSLLPHGMQLDLRTDRVFASYHIKPTEMMFVSSALGEPK